jgi:hypothetical protein
MGGLDEMNYERSAAYIRIAAKYTKPEWTRMPVEQDNAGHANAESKSFAAPEPSTREALYVYLHECAHLVCNHVSRDDNHLRTAKIELEASELAIQWMRAEGVYVSKRLLKYVARNVFHYLGLCTRADYDEDRCYTETAPLMERLEKLGRSNWSLV